MPHTCGTKWDETKIAAQILECKKAMELDRMPSRSEIKSYYGDDRLTNKISKTIGYYGWANRLGLEMKSSDTQTGKNGEQFAAKWLEDNSFDVKRMPQNYPYDLLINGCVKADVKYSNQYTTKMDTSFYSFRLGKEYPTCDLYILIAQPGLGNRRYFIVPSFMVRQKQISIGCKSSLYDKYECRFDIINSYETAFKSVC